MKNYTKTDSNTGAAVASDTAKVRKAHLDKKIAIAEESIVTRKEYLKRLQHEKLNNAGFEIEKLDTKYAFVETYVYKHGKKVFFDIDAALEYADEL